MKSLPQFVAACSLALATLSLPAMPEGWSVTGSMLEARRAHSATLLADGRVLVAGGFTSGGTLRTVELFDPETQTWSMAAPLALSRGWHTATLMADGRVLVAGGHTLMADGRWLVTQAAEVYDPSTDSWTVTAGMSIHRSDHTATALPDGTVLVAGGYADDNLAPCELYDPASGTWRAAGTLGVARWGHRATLLNDGTVLVTGGSNDGDLASTLSSTETYDPASGTWALGPDTATPGVFHTATVMPSGQVLVTGGYDWPPRSSSRAEMLDPRAGHWSAFATLVHRRDSHTATRLANGDILVTGGQAWGRELRYLFVDVLGTTELFSEESGRWREAGSLNEARKGHTATLLLDGRVLVVGGVEFAGERSFRELPLASAELYGVAFPIEGCKNHYILTLPCPAPN